MSFRINTNTQAARSLSALSRTSSQIGERQLRLSTGSKINSAADDSAGFTISNKLTAKTRGQAQALSNIGDAKSMMTVAEGALGTTMDILQTMKEKAVQAGNDSMGADERTAIQSQINALTAEVNDILGGAEFNGTKLFSDTETSSLSFQVGDTASDAFGVSTAQLGISTLGIGTVGEVAADGGLEVGDIGSPTFTGAGAATAEFRITENGSDFELQRLDAGTGEYATIEGYEDLAALQADGPVAVTSGDFSFSLAADAELSDGAAFSISAASASLSSSGDTAALSGIAKTDTAAAGTAEFRIVDGGTGDGSTDMTLQMKDGAGDWNAVGADFTAADGDISVDSGGFTFTLDSGAVARDEAFKLAFDPAEAAAATVDNAGGTLAGTDVTSSLDLSSAAGATAALGTIDAAIKLINTQASEFGDFQNRMDFKAQNLETSMNNYEAANSRIADADFAKEQMEIVKLQILQQTGSAMFAQANSSGQSVLSFF